MTCLVPQQPVLPPAHGSVGIGAVVKLVVAGNEKDWYGRCGKEIVDSLVGCGGALSGEGIVPITEMDQKGIGVGG